MASRAARSSGPRAAVAAVGAGRWRPADLERRRPSLARGAQQRCWNHKILNVLNDLPKRVQGAARALLTQIPTAKTRRQAQRRRDRFVARYSEAYPAAAATLERDWERMVTFYDFPEAHWRHLRTTNPVESPFASVRLRTNAGKRYKRVQGATALIWRVLRVAEDTIPQAQRAGVPAAVYAGREIPGRSIVQERTPPRKESRGPPDLVYTPFDGTSHLAVRRASSALFAPCTLSQIPLNSRNPWPECEDLDGEEHHPHQ